MNVSREKPKTRALLSVANKEGIVSFARGLAERGYEVVSSGGTANLLSKEEIPVTPVADVTGFPQILGGRVKTLHPLIHGGILARRNLASDLEELEQNEIIPVDIVAVNFYPFEAKVAEKSAISEIIENIDIGGPSMVRAAAKNFRHVIPVVDPRDYPLVLGKLDEGMDLATRLYLAVKAFRASARYEAAIGSYMTQLEARGEELVAAELEASLPATLSVSFEKVQDLRYGENPHQSAAFYREASGVPKGVAGARKLQGKELSYNNILDLDAAWRLACEFEETAAVVIKHTNPCGVALGETLSSAYVKARETDPVSAFGGIVGLSRPVDKKTAKELASTFLEAVIAPGFEPDAIEELSGKKNLRLLAIDDPPRAAWEGHNLCRVVGGLLVQDWDNSPLDRELFEIPTKRKPTEQEMAALEFAWKVAKHVKSNAIVIAKDRHTLGIGAGQMSRVDSCRLAVTKAQSSLEGSVAASDAFFPFRDGPDQLADAGVRAIIQPGGSIRDEEVISGADQRELAMVLTGVRHFRH
ncbi:MAG: bifunctional phosphoribosylaminoimidazolecarboxamide formyltransferase/IMP cyclohydrolase [Vicinamibacteria bacterium]